MDNSQISCLFHELPNLIQIIKWAEKAPLSEILKSKHSDLLLELRRKALTQDIYNSYCDVSINTPINQTLVEIENIKKDIIDFNILFKGVYSKAKKGNLLCFKVNKYIDLSTNTILLVKKNSSEAYAYYSIIDQRNLKAKFQAPSKLTLIDNYFLNGELNITLKRFQNNENIVPYLIKKDKGNLLV